MTERTIIIVIIAIIIITIPLLALFLYKNNKSNSQVDTTRIYDQNGQLIADFSNINEVTEIKENLSIQGIVEVHHNGYIYIFNGQHFGEYGFEMEEYTRANIDDENQKCIDYVTSKEYDTSYIEEGDILICKGDLTSYSIKNDDLDTKDNPIIVLKADDYNKMQHEAIKEERTAVVTIGEYFDFNGEIYLKYEISDKEYKLPFVLRFNVKEDNTNIKGKLEKGKKVKVEYKNPNISTEQLVLKSIEVI